MYYICPYIYHFCCLSFFLEDPTFFLVSFPFFLRNFLSQFSWNMYAGQKKLRIPSSENVFNSPSSLKNIFPGLRILG